MTARWLLGLICLLPAVATTAGEQPARYTIEQLMASDSFGGLSFSPDNRKLLLTSTRTGAANIYVIDVGGGELRALTSSKEPLAAIGYFPADERVLYTSDGDGNELNHLYVRELDSSTHDLTPGEKVKAKFVAWATDGRSLFAVTNERDARYFDLYEYSLHGYKRRLLFQNDAGYQVRAVSPDRRYVALSRIIDNANTHAFLYDTRSHELKLLTTGKAPISSTPEAFSRDGAALFFNTDEDHEFQYLARLDLKSGERKTISKTDWDVESASLSEDGKYLLVSVNEDARSRVHLLDAKTFEPAGNFKSAVLAGLGPGTVESFELANGKPLAAAIVANGDVPGDIYVLDFESGKKTRLLRALAPTVKRDDLVAGEVVRYKSYDGLTVPGVLYVPKGAVQRAELPAVVNVHGGPGSESRIGYKPLVQYLVNHGYVVYDVNNRGSSGSGKTFYHLDDHHHGNADLDDVVASRGMLVGTGYVDPSRIAIMGGSYGGYMTLAALTFRPQAFAAGVDLYGVANWPRLLQNTPAWWTDLRRLLATEVGDPVQDDEYLRGISPIFHAEKIVRPLMVLQGANDPRVLQIESDDIVAKARANGVPVEYMVFPDEGHFFRRKATQIAAYSGIETFLDKHVKTAAVGRSATPAESLNAFFEAVFQRDLARSPIRESKLGIKTHQDQWDDVSEERALADAELARGDLRSLRRFDYDQLAPQEQLSYRLFERSINEGLKGFQWRRSSYLLTQMGGLHRTVATTLLNRHTIADRADADAYVARLSAVKPLMAQLVVELKRQEDAGVKPPRFVYPLTIGEAENLITGRPFDSSDKDSPIYADFKSKLTAAKFSAADQQLLSDRAERALRDGFGAGYRELIEHLREASKTATDEDGVWKLPNGAAYYRYALESYTTLPITAEQLHELGLKEVARIHAEMRKLQAKLGFRGSLSELFDHVRNDPQSYYPDTREGRSQYMADANALLAEVRARQGEVLGRTPKADVIVRSVEPWREKSAPKAFYQGPPQDGSQPGIFYINLYDMRAAPKYQLAVVLYHEAIPGHHVETVVAHELPDLPKFRKFDGFAAFSEGWGLYSELVAREMGLYRDPHQDFGRLSLSLMRAARLVVDTGLHAKKWTREQAVDYLDRNMPSTHYDNQREIDRYIVLPGQATSYAVGMLKILELRERSRKELGARFDLKAFHDVVLGSGPLPLPVLEENVLAWIKSQRPS
jgi:uncharacterized protein (DUF885 family)/dipeptidyl aminopeptidase/acylaminoacyl peptidase